MVGFIAHIGAGLPLPFLRKSTAKIEPSFDAWRPENEPERPAAQRVRRTVYQFSIRLFSQLLAVGFNQ
ncbi:hypothetical protein AB4Y44_15925 [Paraburkholderia sp. BR10937]|uniref:hypothetical protein n=1 Tax=Paraburkholderia sp. BR10937 TaxID=3236994 RepID=UPI0034D18265